MEKTCKLGPIIKDIRTAQGLSQFDLAVKSGLGISTLQKMEQQNIDDGQVRLDTIRKLASAFNMTAAELVKMLG